MTISIEPVPDLQADDLTWTDTLRDGTAILVRPIRPSDERAERRFMEQAPPDSRRFRFLGVAGTSSVALPKQFTHIDPHLDMAFVALIDDDDRATQIGVSRYGAGIDGTACECAVVVSDEWQNRGVATVLMEHLMDVARARGIERMYSIDSNADASMHGLATHLGFQRESNADNPMQVIHRFDLQTGVRRTGADAPAVS
jgi:GNAT superfamily N-acetyltransferase